MNKKQAANSIVLIAVLLAGILIYTMISGVTSDKSVRTLEMLQTYLVGGRIFDADGSLGITDEHSIHYKWSDDMDEVRIQFGNNVIDLTEEQLKDPHILELMDNLNLEFKGTKLYYEGAEVPK